jgi:hypothetical protein
MNEWITDRTWYSWLQRSQVFVCKAAVGNKLHTEISLLKLNVTFAFETLISWCKFKLPMFFSQLCSPPWITNFRLSDCYQGLLYSSLSARVAATYDISKIITWIHIVSNRNFRVVVLLWILQCCIAIICVHDRVWMVRFCKSPIYNIIDMLCTNARGMYDISFL